jgi:hypothetical protein
LIQRLRKLVELVRPPRSARDATRAELRPRLCLLLVAWALTLLAPALHVDEIDADTVQSGHGGHSASECPGFSSNHRAPHGAELVAGCNASDCRDPTHHHHSLYHHDATRCPACASIAERVSDLASFYLEMDLLAAVAAVEPARLPDSSQRHLIALARGPPRPRSLLTVGTSAA